MENAHLRQLERKRLSSLKGTFQPYPNVLFSLMYNVCFLDSCNEMMLVSWDA